MSAIILNLTIVAALLLVYFLFKRTLVRTGVALALFLYVADALLFGGGSLRTHAEQARAQGKSQEFVDGLAAMNKAMMPVRAKIALGTLGLLVIGLTGGVIVQRKRQEKP